MLQAPTSFAISRHITCDPSMRQLSYILESGGRFAVRSPKLRLFP